MIENENFPTVFSTHQDIVKSIKKDGRGIYLFSVWVKDGSKVNGSVTVSFLKHSDFAVKSSSIGQAFANKTLGQAIKRYDLSYQYCVMFEFNGQAIGGAFIPLDKPKGLQDALLEAFMAYSLR